MVQTSEGGAFTFAPTVAALFGSGEKFALVALVREVLAATREAQERSARFASPERSFRLLGSVAAESARFVPEVAVTLRDGRSVLARWTNAAQLSRSLKVSRTQALAMLSVLEEKGLIEAYEEQMVPADPAAADVAWFYLDERSVERGPHSDAEIRTFVQDQRITPSTQVWCKGLSGWFPYDEARARLQSVRKEQAEIAVERRTCPGCRKEFPKTDLVHFNGKWICAACGPSFFAGLQPGRSAPPSEPARVGLVRRFLAWTADVLCYYTVVRAAEVAGGLAGLWELTFFLSPLVFTLEFAGGVLWNTLFLTLFGASPGKWLLGLHVEDARGRNPSPVRAFLRTVFGLVPGGPLFAVFRIDRRALHDLVVQTEVRSVRAAKTPESKGAAEFFARQGMVRALVFLAPLVACAGLVHLVQIRRLELDLARWTDSAPKRPPASRGGYYPNFATLQEQWKSFAFAAPNGPGSRLELRSEDVELFSSTLPAFARLRGAYGIRIVDGRIVVSIFSPLPAWLGSAGTGRYLNATAWVKASASDGRWMCELERVESPIATPERMEAIRQMFDQWVVETMREEKSNLSPISSMAIGRETMVLQR